MCDVTTTAGALGLAGQGLGGLARLSQARKAEKRAKRAAAAEQAAAKDRADDVRRRARAELGSRRARFAKAGVKADGTPIAVLRAIEADGEDEAAALLQRGRARADAIRDRARDARRRTRTDLLGGVASARLLGGFPVTGDWPGAGRGR